MPPTDLPPTQDPHQRPPASPSRSEDPDGGSDVQMWVIAKMVGTAFMFLGFLQIFLSISGGFELSGVVALLLYFGGLAIWANAAIDNPPLRWGITIGALALSIGFLHFGEILFWHKQVVFWATVIIVMYFMFNEPKKPDRP